ncbi:flagellar basal body L-ring protein FlgH [Massilia sp. MB5]|uniref:flagellar basal body L-ring protein FlgH n=1 Tax=unclassified Massilia TaxID=2609279 RepID=UPI00067CD13E|nr:MULTISPECIES: flagellar basal body L-ring protein FlgH [unclassified Massilia]AKU20627.1 flagellar basal body L-ring protein [Massilia sp. NR 4-1]UMR29899.1 flagellar basal body L-ring protein FlgH [Massilia sp. MB5]
MKAVLSTLVLALLLAGCAQPPVRPAPFDEPPPVARVAPSRGTSGGVFDPEGGVSLTSDSRAFRVGDLVTVLLQETTQASKSAGTKLSKDSSTAIAAPGLLGKTFPKAGVDLSGKNGFAGDSSSTQQNTLNGAITVIVQEVLPNGLLRVAGEKNLTLNQGEEFLRLRGYLRAADIDANNQVSSLRIANARIAYSANGTLADVQQPGWLTRFFVGPWMPF